MISHSAANELVNQFRTGYWMVDVFIGVLSTWLISKLLDKKNWYYLVDLFNGTDFEFHSKIYEHDQYVMNSSASYQLFIEFFQKYTDNNMARKKKMSLTLPDYQCPSTFNIDFCTLNFIPESEFLYKSKIKVKFVEPRQEKDMPKPSNYISIWYNNISDMEELLSDIKEVMYVPNESHKSIRFNYHRKIQANRLPYQTYLSHVTPIPLSSLMLQSDVKTQLQRRIDDFKHSNKLVFLAYGEPGNGKTSLSKAIIDHLGIKIVSVITSLDEIGTDERLRNIFHRKTSVTDPHMIIFEEIDAGDRSKVLAKRKCFDAQDKEDTDDEKKKSTKKKDACTITLSAWLDIFDGLMELRNTVVVITTNDIEYLDPAVYRQGRVSMVINFSNVSNTSFKEFVNEHFNIADPIIPDGVEHISHSILFDAQKLYHDDYDAFEKQVIGEIHKKIKT